VTENGEKQALLTAGDVSGGTMVYAPGEDDVTVPSTAAFTTDIPTGIAAGT
jgi:hypothetical protein